MSKRNLLICFDAFGTLFKPRRPVARQYAEVATSLGLRGITEEKVEASFKKAFKQESKQNPNYGKANGMNAEKWWSHIIQNTIHPLAAADQQLPQDLIPKLLHRFWSDEGYMLLPNVPLVLRGARNLQNLRYDRVVVGIITNSDDRVPDILTSLGVKMSPLRFAQGKREADDGSMHWDVDFAVMSYDVGFEKPDRRIFDAACEMLTNLAAPKNAEESDVDLDSWEKVYVGDEYAKDVVGANSAGWNAVLIMEAFQDVDQQIQWRENDQPGNLTELFQSWNAVGFSCLSKLAQWLR